MGRPGLFALARPSPKQLADGKYRFFFRSFATPRFGSNSHGARHKQRP
jgi:hypothetical protein